MRYHRLWTRSRVRLGSGLGSDATLWRLQFPRYGDDHTACEWVEVVAQGVPGHIGTPSPGHGYESGDPFADFLPPPIVLAPDDQAERLRAVVFVRDGTPKDGQRY